MPQADHQHQLADHFWKWKDQVMQNNQRCAHTRRAVHSPSLRLQCTYDHTVCPAKGECETMRACPAFAPMPQSLEKIRQWDQSLYVATAVRHRLNLLKKQNSLKLDPKNAARPTKSLKIAYSCINLQFGSNFKTTAITILRQAVHLPEKGRGSANPRHFLASSMVITSSLLSASAFLAWTSSSERFA